MSSRRKHADTHLRPTNPNNVTNLKPAHVKEELEEREDWKDHFHMMRSDITLQVLSAHETREKKRIDRNRYDLPKTT